MFMSFAEEYVGALSTEDSAKLIHEIGIWKDIQWDSDAASRVFHYCGGHPFVTRLFASEVCRRGRLKQIDLARVDAAAEEVRRMFRRNEIGGYYRRGVMDELRDDEREVVRFVVDRAPAGRVADLPVALEDALAALERFGLLRGDGDEVALSATLFDSWLRDRAGR